MNALEKIKEKYILLFRCKYGKHKFIQSNYRKTCIYCRAEQILVSRPYPRIGEVKYCWRDVPIIGYWNEKKWQRVSKKLDK